MCQCSCKTSSAKTIRYAHTQKQEWSSDSHKLTKSESIRTHWCLLDQLHFSNTYNAFVNKNFSYYLKTTSWMSVSTTPTLCRKTFSTPAWSSMVSVEPLLFCREKLKWIWQRKSITSIKQWNAGQSSFWIFNSENHPRLPGYLTHLQKQKQRVNLC